MPLTAEERAERDALEYWEASVPSSAQFTADADERFPPPEHSLVIHDVFDRARHGKTKTLLSAPPRHVKTHSVKHGLARTLTYDPAGESAYVSATATLADDKSEEIRRIVRGSGGTAEGPRKNWRTAQGGRLLALGIDGQYTGTGTTAIQVFDDPYPNASKALSPTYRAKVVTFKEGVADNRLEDEASQLILHTRMTPQDLIGRLLDTEGHRWNYVKIQAVKDYSQDAADLELDKERQRQELKRQYRDILLEKGSPVPAELQPDFPSYAGLLKLGLPIPEDIKPDLDSIGKAIWPEYWPLEKLLPLMRYKRWWWALYQQEPQPDGARVFYEPARFRLEDYRVANGFRLDGLRVGLGADPAASEKQSADHSVAVLMGMRGFGNSTQAWIFHVERIQESVTNFAQRLVRLQRKFRCPVHVEAVAGFKAVPQAMKLIAQLGPQQMRCHQHGIIEGAIIGSVCSTCMGPLELDSGQMRVHEAPALGSKFLRAQPLAAAWNDGRVLVPQDAHWADGFISRFLSFTGADGEEDDEPDAAAHVFNALFREAPALVRGPREILSLPFA